MVLKYMKNTHQLINNIIGQLKGIDKMIEERRDCLEIMVQLKAVKSAVASLMNNLVNQEFNRCVKQLKAQDKNKLKKMFENIIKNN